MALFYITHGAHGDKLPIAINVNSIESFEPVEQDIVEIKTATGAYYTIDESYTDMIGQLAMYSKFCGLGKLNNIGEDNADDYHG